MSLGLAETDGGTNSCLQRPGRGTDGVEWGGWRFQESGEYAACLKEAAVPQLQPTVSMACEIADLVLRDGLGFREKLEIQFLKNDIFLKCLLIYNLFFLNPPTGPQFVTLM